MNPLFSIFSSCDFRVMPNTPSTRSTRSGLTATATSLNDIKALIDDNMKGLTGLIGRTRNEIIQTFRSEELHKTISELKENVHELQKSNELLKKKNQYIEEELIVLKQQQTENMYELTHEVEER